jgi:hypothetical protein
VASFVAAVLGALVTGLAAWVAGAVVKPGGNPAVTRRG